MKRPHTKGISFTEGENIVRDHLKSDGYNFDEMNIIINYKWEGKSCIDWLNNYDLVEPEEYTEHISKSVDILNRAKIYLEMLKIIKNNV